LRSSKDRHDVSIASQERELQKLANSKDLQIVREYVDVVESAKNEFRPAFQELMRDVRSPARGWDTLLTLDTSRLSRRRYVSLVFKHDAKKNGVQILYAKMPEVDPITNVLLESVMEALDEYHSLVSREKGLAGMAENVRQGFRAGGRAPRGSETDNLSQNQSSDLQTTRAG
jgi:DNA invertase Pin-like site-specific DNA recombinase